MIRRLTLVLALTFGPQVYHVFDGLVVWMKLMLTTDGAVLLDVRGGASLLEEDGQFRLGGQGQRRGTMAHVDQSVHAQVLVNDRVRLTPGEDGVWRHTFGDVALDGLQMTVSVTPR